MYAYIDESGNTGSNLFDPEQPYFLTVAMSSPTDFDDVFRHRVGRIAHRAGVDHLHANEMGEDVVEVAAASLMELVEFSQVRLYFAAVNKPDVAALKFFDAIFDPGENRAAPFHSYSLTVLRFQMVKDFVGLLDVADTKLFWNAMTRPRSEQSVRDALSAIDSVLERVPEVDDPRSRVLIGDTLHWARGNIDNFSFWSSNIRSHYGQLPNVFTLPQLLNGISKAAKHWGTRIERIIHDQQSQFGRTLRAWHSAFARHDQELELHFGDTPIRLADLHGSRFEMVDSRVSPGLQVADLILWTFSRSLGGKSLGPNSTALVEMCFSPEDYYFMSLGSLMDTLDLLSTALVNRPITEDQILDGIALVRDFERRRQERLATT